MVGAAAVEEVGAVVRVPLANAVDAWRNEKKIYVSFCLLLFIYCCFHVICFVEVLFYCSFAVRGEVIAQLEE